MVTKQLFIRTTENCYTISFACSHGEHSRVRAHGASRYQLRDPRRFFLNVTFYSSTRVRSASDRLEQYLAIERHADIKSSNKSGKSLRPSWIHRNSCALSDISASFDRKKVTLPVNIQPLQIKDPSRSYELAVEPIMSMCRIRSITKFQVSQWHNWSGFH